MAIRLMVASAEDWALWRELRLRALRDAPHAFASKLVSWQVADEARWRERLSVVGSCNLIALAGDRSVGMVSGLPDETDVSLIGLWVAPELRGKGVGDALVQGLITWARTTAAKLVTLDVKPSNVIAMRTYERNGFVKRGRQRNGDIRMVRHLG